MQLEAVKPAHGRLAPARPTCKDPMGVDAAVVAHCQGGRVDARDPSPVSLAGGQITAERDEGPREQLHKAGITDERREIRAQMGLHVFRVVMVEGPVMTTMEIDEDGADLTEGQGRLPAPVAVTRLEQASGIERFKSLAEIINIAEHSRELQLAHRNPLV
jgi:hypothetical protein